MKVLTLIPFIITGIACNAPMNDPAPSSTLKTIILNVEVTHLYDNSLEMDSAVTQAHIFLYDEEQERTDSINAIRESHTDSVGKARIDFVNYEHGDNEIFVKVAHASLGIKLYQPDLPPGSATTLKVIY